MDCDGSKINRKVRKVIRKVRYEKGNIKIATLACPLRPLR